MAQRVAINTLWSRGISRQIIAGNRARVSTKEEDYRTGKIAAGRELHSPEMIKKNYGIIPLLIIMGVGVIGLSGFIFRNLMTRDDIRFHSSGKFGYEEEENFDRQRKFLAFNQKYGAPAGLKELYEELKHE